MTDHSTDTHVIDPEGTTVDLGADDCALVIDSNNTHTLYLPKNLCDDNDSIMPDHVLMVTAMAVRFSQDPQWGRDLLQ